MANHVSGTSALISVPPTCLGELRQHVLLPLIGHPLFREAEQLRANHFVHESDDIARLTRWGTNVLAEIARREADAARQRCHRTMHEVLRHLRTTALRGHCSPPPRPLPSWVPGAPLPNQANRRAGTFDRLAAARFLPTDSLTLVNLLCRQSR